MLGRLRRDGDETFKTKTHRDNMDTNSQEFAYMWVGGYTLYSCIGPNDQSRLERCLERLSLVSIPSLHVSVSARSRHSKVLSRSRDSDVSVSSWSQHHTSHLQPWLMIIIVARARLERPASCTKGFRYWCSASMLSFCMQFAGYRLHRLMIVPNFVFTFQFFNLLQDYMYQGLKK